MSLNKKVILLVLIDVSFVLFFQSDLMSESTAGSVFLLNLDQFIISKCKYGFCLENVLRAVFNLCYFVVDLGICLIKLKQIIVQYILDVLSCKGQ